MPAVSPAIQASPLAELPSCYGVDFGKETHGIEDVADKWDRVDSGEQDAVDFGRDANQRGEVFHAFGVHVRQSYRLRVAGLELCYTSSEVGEFVEI